MKASENLAKISLYLFVAYVVSYAFETLFDVPLFGNRIMLPELVFLVFAFFSGLYLLKTKAYTRIREIRLQPLDWGVLAYFVSVLMSFLVNQKRTALGEVCAAGYYMTLYFLVILVFQNQRKRIYKIFLKSMLYSGLIASVCAIGFYIYSSMTGEMNRVWTYEKFPIIGDTIRASGFNRYPAYLADHAIVTVLVAFLLFVRKEISRPFMLVSVAILWCCAILAKEKSNVILLALIFLNLPLFFDYQRFMKLGLRFLGIVLILFYVFYTNFIIVKDIQNSPFPRYAYLWPVAIGNTHFFIESTPYVDLKQACLISFSESPIVGIGGGSLGPYSKILGQRGLILQPNVSPHSTLFGVLGELGLAGFLSLIFILMTVFKGIKRYIGSSEQKIYLALFAFFCLFGINADMMNLRHYWLFLAFLAMLVRSFSHQNTEGYVSKN